MKIIQIMPEFGLAGAEIMCENLTYELKNMGHDVIVISMYDYHSAITDRLEENKIKVIYLNKKSGLDLSMITKMISVFRNEKPEVIHTHRYVMQYAIPAAIITGIKHRVHTVHNVAKMENSKPARVLNSFFFRFANVTPVALSNEIQKTIVEEYKLEKTSIPVVLNGINLSKCIKKQSYELQDEIRILHIGRFSNQKNHKGLIEAFILIHEQFPNARLELIGDGENRDKILGQIKKNKLEQSIRILGQQNNVFDYLNNADIFVLPSNYEGIPMTLIEAMATGLPIVATNVGGIPDMLMNAEDAFVVNNNVTELAEAVEKLLQDKNLRIKFGTNAKIKSVKFSARVMAERYLKIYTA